MSTIFAKLILHRNLYQTNLIQCLRIKSALRGGPRDLALQIELIGYYSKLVGQGLCASAYPS